MQEIKPGVYTTLSNPEYHHGPGINKGLLDLIHKSPLHAKAALVGEPEAPTEAMKVGTAVHALVLEPKEYERLYAVAPHVDRRTKAGKEAWAQFCEEHAGAEIITEDTAELVRAIAASVHAHPAAHALLSAEGKAEMSAYWQDTISGELCKCRPDFWRRDGIIVDLKTTEDASPEGFARSVVNYRYYVQAPWYLEGLRHVFDAGLAPEGYERPKGFVFVAVEKKPPFAVGVYVLEQAAYETGAHEARADLDKFAQCKREDRWPGYGDAIAPLALPAWFTNRQAA
ncbi:PD-(D/E)XK nuclease-like domain-containing protein (plasmid) [Roseomonas marmotae]|uniref:PD-(D/E)XK nuclease-like domain-containing protein n=1 Tax=Roseomonas marmotae TaxID=2768161 RepID=UPI001AD683E2|nr:PD-(D/E)XK nuclease-like domain-containing protein [Roseomonas marmotae]QTI81459.1 PD-(D/E)XK nuclease-like domain-containing protein [Roseomonas marmotae]